MIIRRTSLTEVEFQRLKPICDRAAAAACRRACVEHLHRDACAVAYTAILETAEDVDSALLNRICQRRVQDWLRDWTHNRIRAEHPTQLVCLGFIKFTQDFDTPAEVSRIMSRIPERDRIVLRLRFMEGLSQAETAPAMGVSPSRVQQLEARAIKRAREAVRL